MRLPWWGVTVALAIVLVALLILMVFLEGKLTDGIDWRFWRLGLQPSIIIYIFLIFPFIQRLWNRALQSLQLLVPENKRQEIIEKITRYDRRWEWTAIFLGVLFTVTMFQPWNMAMNWTDVYALITTIITFSLLSLIIYGGLAGTLRLAKLNRQYIQLDIYDTRLLVPVARWSLSVSLAFVGGISLSIAFQPLEDLRTVQNIVVYSILVGVTLLLFFSSMLSTHNAMASAKKRELAMVRKNLDDARSELKHQATEGIKEGTDRFYSAIAVWGIYERQVQEIPTWPFNAGIIGRLIVSAIVPAIIYMIKVFTGLRLGL